MNESWTEFDNFLCSENTNKSILKKEIQNDQNILSKLTLILTYAFSFTAPSLQNTTSWNDVICQGVFYLDMLTIYSDNAMVYTASADLLIAVSGNKTTDFGDLSQVWQRHCLHNVPRSDNVQCIRNSDRDVTNKRTWTRRLSFVSLSTECCNNRVKLITSLYNGNWSVVLPADEKGDEKVKKNFLCGVKAFRPSCVP